MSGHTNTQRLQQYVLVTWWLQNRIYKSAAITANTLLVSVFPPDVETGVPPIQPQDFEWGPTLILGDKVWLPVSSSSSQRCRDAVKVRALCWPGKVFPHAKLGKSFLGFVHGGMDLLKTVARPPTNTNYGRKIGSALLATTCLHSVACKLEDILWPYGVRTR